MAVGFNERKAQVLALLSSENDWVSCREVAGAFGITQANAGMLLRGYSHDGLTKCRKVSPPVGRFYYEFKIGKAGRAKLIWLLGRSIAQAPLPGFDIEVGRPRVLRPRVVKRVVRPRILREES